MEAGKVILNVRTRVAVLHVSLKILRNAFVDFLERDDLFRLHGTVVKDLAHLCVGQVFVSITACDQTNEDG